VSKRDFITVEEWGPEEVDGLLALAMRVKRGEVIGGLERKSRVLSEKERDIVAHHEIGHALVASSLPQADPVHKVTIIPRGVGALGATYQLPLEDRYLLTRSELEDRIAVLLGGRVAEEVVYGEISTGAHNDLERATELARAMVFEYGMSEVAPSRTMRADNYALSEETKRLRDSEQARLTDHAYDEAQRLLRKHRSALDRVAEALLEKETLDRSELEALLADIKPESRSSETIGTIRALPARD